MFKRTFALAAALGFLATPAFAQDAKSLAAEGKGVIQQFAGALTNELKGAMQTGGPLAGIETCNVKAGPITAQASKASGWTVKRSSHKLRNPNNAPDAFEQRAIREFQARQAAGEKAETMATALVVIENGQKVFRMAKAIPTGPVCLNCHGSEIKPEVAAKLDELYPSDQARGFSQGEMRGIFSLKKPL